MLGFGIVTTFGMGLIWEEMAETAVCMFDRRGGIY